MDARTAADLRMRSYSLGSSSSAPSISSGSVDPLITLTYTPPSSNPTSPDALGVSVVPSPSHIGVSGSSSLNSIAGGFGIAMGSGSASSGAIEMRPNLQRLRTLQSIGDKPPSRKPPLRPTMLQSSSPSNFENNTFVNGKREPARVRAPSRGDDKTRKVILDGARKIKLSLFGSARCGKSSLSLRLSRNIYYQDYDESSTPEDIHHQLTVDGMSYQLHLRDISCSYFAIHRERCIDWPEGFIFAYDVTNRSSFEEVSGFRFEVLSNRDFRLIPCILVCLKCDAGGLRAVTREEGEKRAREFGCPYLEVSSLNNFNVELAFESIVRQVIRVDAISSAGSNPASPTVFNRSIHHTVHVVMPSTLSPSPSSSHNGAEGPSSSLSPSSSSSSSPFPSATTSPSLENVLVIPDIPTNESGVMFCGFLIKRGNKVKSWKKRWFVLTRQSLKYFYRIPPSANDIKDLIGIITLKGCHLLGDPDIQFKKDHNSFALVCSSPPRVYHLWAESRDLKTLWLHHLTYCIAEPKYRRLSAPCLVESTYTDNSASADSESTGEDFTLSDGVSGPSTPRPAEEGHDRLATMDRATLHKLAVDAFNIKPKKGIAILVEAKHLEMTPESVAHFLTTCEGLKKSKIGEYLGEGDEFNVRTLEAYVESLGCSGKSIDDALRQFLSGFRLPGEAQKIDRIMERFAGRFHRENPGIYASPDTAYVLSFSLIMLNTDLHNPNVQNKMTKDSWIVQHRGIDRGGDLPRDYLEALYDKILHEEIVMEHERDDFVQWEKQGWMNKQRANVKKFDKFFFILGQGCLYYFKNPQDPAPRGILPLENVWVSYTKERNEIVLASAFGKMKSLKGTRLKMKDKYVFSVETEKEWKQWCLSLQQNTCPSPNYTALAMSKKASW